MKRLNTITNTSSLQLAVCFLATIPVLLLAHNADASDYGEQQAEQIRKHEQAVIRTINGFISGDIEGQERAQADIAASEAYWAVTGANPADPRMVGHLFTQELARSPANVPGFSVRILHHRLNQRVGFEVDFSDVIRLDAFHDAKNK